MSNLTTDLQKGDVNVEPSSLHEPVVNDSLIGDLASPKIGSLVKDVKQGKRFVLSRKQLDASEGWVHELFLRSSYGLSSNWVPKHLISIDEKYLRCCLEVIYISAFDASPSGGLFNRNSLELGFFGQGWPAASRISRRGLADSVGKSFIDHPMETVEGGNTALNPVEQWMVGSITESDSMKSILKSPLFQRIGMLENASRCGMTDLTDNKRFLRPRLTGSSELSYTSATKLEEDNASVGSHHRFLSSGSIQRSPVSVSSMDSMLNDQASCSYPRNYRGMLQCSWKDGGLPHFEFSVDDQKELYMASPVNEQLANENSVIQEYLFQMKHGSLYGEPSSGWSSEVIGKMKVSTSYTLCRCNSKVMETDYVLCGLGDIHGSGSQSVSSLRGTKHRKLSKVMDLFKSSQLFKQRSNSRFGGGSSAILESHPEESLDVGNRSVCPMGNPDYFLQSDFSPNRELVAVVMKRHVEEEDSQRCREDDGGWGLKFLKTASMKQINPTPQVSESAPPCGDNSGECARSATDIILSAGIHSLPRSGKELPSSIIERWKSGGSCDCGGWDMGCPLTILKSSKREEEGLPGSDRQNDCKSVDVFSECLEQGTPPILKLTNIHDGLYFVNFRSTVSVVQCFSVAVAMIHSQMPFLRPK